MKLVFSVTDCNPQPGLCPGGEKSTARREQSERQADCYHQNLVKKPLAAFMLVFAMLLTVSASVYGTAGVTAAPTASAVLIDGRPMAFEAYHIDGYNYFKLRDLAYALSGTPRQFDVLWHDADNAIALSTGKPYTPIGGEMAGKSDAGRLAVPTAAKVILDGVETSFNAYNIGGSNYFLLRELGHALGFDVAWAEADNAIHISTSAVRLSPQLAPMRPGETIAVMTTNHGDVSFRFFPEFAPLAVENFLTHAANGYYDGIIFHRVVPGFVIQGGDPTGTGMGGDSIWGKPFQNEDMPGLHHIRGALAMANSDPDTNGSQFFIVSNNQLDEETAEMLMQMRDEQDTGIAQDDDGRVYTVGHFFQPAIIDKYLAEGGAPFLDNPFGRYTVFGQVIDGLDIVDAISSVPFREEAMRPGEGRPLEDVVIIKIAMTTYN